MNILYPGIQPYSQQYLSVDPVHSLYIEQCGHPDGTSVLFVHDGPGCGCLEQHRRFFDPEKYRIILFDQRGCGRSSPYGELINNTTTDLLADMERIRDHLAIDQWILCGEGWGGALAFMYADSHSTRVRAIVTIGLSEGSLSENSWRFSSVGAAFVFPEMWQTFESLIPESERSDLVGAYYQRLTGCDEVARMSAAKHWARWRLGLLSLTPNSVIDGLLASPHWKLAQARIEAHYWVHQYFVGQHSITECLSRIAHMTCILIHGRYDMLSPVMQSTALAQQCSDANLTIIREAGHCILDQGLSHALIHTMDRLSALFES